MQTKEQREKSDVHRDARYSGRRRYVTTHMDAKKKPIRSFQTHWQQSNCDRESNVSSPFSQFIKKSK